MTQARVYRITAVQVEDIQGIHRVDIRPEGDRWLFFIGGKNMAGKSSLLSAITMAFGGKRTQVAEPVRRGADVGRVEIELDGGDLSIKRVVRPDGESVLEVRDRLGQVKSPQATIDKLIGSKFVDPLAFLLKSDKEQQADLMRIIPGAEEIVRLDADRKRHFDRRTEVGRDLERAKVEIQTIPAKDPGKAIDVGALAAERAAFADEQHAGAKLASTRDNAVRDTQSAVKARVATAHMIATLETQLADLQEKIDDLRKKHEKEEVDVARLVKLTRAANEDVERAAAAWKAGQPRRDEIDAELRRADDHNRGVFAAEAQQKRLAQVNGEADRLQNEYDGLTERIAAFEAQKAGILAAAALPVEGISFGPAGILLRGSPFAQASDAERWRVALAVAIEASPGLGDVVIRGGERLDDDSLALVAKQAEAAAKRVWIERVGTRDPGVIEIVEGRATYPGP